MSGSVAAPVPIAAIAPETAVREVIRDQTSSSRFVALPTSCACQRPAEEAGSSAPIAGIATSIARVTVSPFAVRIAAAT